MFDLITGHATHIPQRPMLPLVISTTLQVVLIAAAAAVPLLFMTEHAPRLPTIMAFVAAPPPPPPPPPPAPAPAPARRPSATARSVPTTGSQPVPLAAPSQITPEAASATVDDGVPGGVEGGIPGGVVGGVVGGLISEIPPPPVAPPPPPLRRPVRIGGQIETPALLRRVEPIYPDVAVHARVQGLVILEAVVDERGRVADVTVLRSVHPALDREAVAAVRQWRYRPLQLNGIPASFVLTVTLSFSLHGSAGS